MKTAKAPARLRPVMVSALAAKVLGHSRVATTPALSARQVTATFPAFNALELAYAMSELVEKQLFTQKGHDDRATYALTERGRTGAVGIS